MKYKKKKRESKLAPKTERYCLSCEKNTLWEYERAIHHSRCSECGGRLSQSPKEINPSQG